MTPATQEKLTALWVEHYHDVVAAQARKPGMDDVTAEDIAQQAFIRLGKYLDRGAPGADLALIHAMANRVRVDLYRAEHPVLDTTPDGEEIRAQFVSLDADRDTIDRDGVTGMVEELQYRPCLDFEFAPTFDRSLRALPAAERDAFVLVELRGLTTREAGAMLGLDHSNIVRRVTTAKTYIGKELAA